MEMDDTVSKLFVYGTLIFTPVMEAVTGRQHEGQAAKLHNFAAYKVVGDVYPGIWHLEGVSTDGILYQDIDAKDLEILDRYEGEEYNREILSIETEDGDTHRAWVYTYRPAYRHMLSEVPWNPDYFNESELEAYVARLNKQAD